MRSEQCVGVAGMATIQHLKRSTQRTAHHGAKKLTSRHESVLPNFSVVSDAMRDGGASPGARAPVYVAAAGVAGAFGREAFHAFLHGPAGRTHADRRPLVVRDAVARDLTRTVLDAGGYAPGYGGVAPNLAFAVTRPVAIDVLTAADGVLRAPLDADSEAIVVPVESTRVEVRAADHDGDAYSVRLRTRDALYVPRGWSCAFELVADDALHSALTARKGRRPVRINEPSEDEATAAREAARRRAAAHQVVRWRYAAYRDTAQTGYVGAAHMTSVNAFYPARW